jgi:hypothetical protein
MLSHGLKGPQMVYPRYPCGPTRSYTPTRRLKEASPPSGEGPHGSGEGPTRKPPHKWCIRPSSGGQTTSTFFHCLSLVNMQGNTSWIHHHHPFYDGLIQGRRFGAHGSMGPHLKCYKYPLTPIHDYKQETTLSLDRRSHALVVVVCK